MHLNYRRLFGDDAPREEGRGALMSRLNVGISPSASRATKRPLLVILALSAPPPSLGEYHTDHNHNNNEKAGHVAPPGMLSLKTSIYPTRHVAESSDCLRRRRVVQEQLRHGSTAANHRSDHGV